MNGKTMQNDIMRLVLGAVTALCLTAGRLPAAEEDFHVKSEPVRVDQDGQVASDGQLAPSSTLRRYNTSGKDWLEIVSRTLKPTGTMSFDKFHGREKSRFIMFDYVDVVSNNTEGVNGGVVVGRDGLPIAGEKEIKVFLLRPAPQNAGQFPLLAEGNLTGGNAGTQGAHWRVKVIDTAEKRLEISYVYPKFFIGRGQGQDGPKLVTMIVIARDEEGRPVSGVDVTVNVKTEIGILKEAWQEGPTGGSPPQYTTVVHQALPKPQDTAKKYILQATAQGYKDAEVEVPIAKAHWDLADGVAKGEGLDIISDPPWLVVAEGKTSHAATLVMDESLTPATVTIASEAPGVAGITPAAATSQSTPTPVVGVTANKTNAKATSTEELARLQITVKKNVQRKIKFVFVQDKSGHSASLDAAKRKALTEAASDLLGLQSGVTFAQTTDSGKPFEVEGDLGDKPTQESLKSVLQNIQSQEGGGGVMVVAVVWAMEPGGGYADYDGGCFIEQTAGNQVLSHELCHNLGRWDHSNDQGTLMAPGASNGLGNGRILRPYEADIINR